MNTATSATCAQMIASGNLSTSITRVGELDRRAMDEMWSLFSRHYEGVTPARFESDLRDKSHLILSRDTADGVIRGFSTIQVLQRRIGGKRIVAIYSGDTILDPAYWGRRDLQRAFCRFLLLTKLRSPGTPLYWFLVSKGFKTYLLLARNFVRFWPRQGETTPAYEAAIIDALAAEKFGDAYSNEAGLVRAVYDGGRVRTGLAPITLELMKDANIRFFAEKNPEHALGDELCCLGRFDFTTCGRALAKLFWRARRR